jgi:hypothetical protein
MTTLKEARESDNLARFVKEHRRDAKGSATSFNATFDYGDSALKYCPMHRVPGVQY